MSDLMIETDLSEADLADIHQIGATLQRAWNEGDGAFIRRPFHNGRRFHSLEWPPYQRTSSDRRESPENL